MKFVVEGFGGKNMRLDPRRVENPVAQVATDCEIERGALHPLAADPNAGVGSVSGSAVSMFWYERSFWMSANEDTNYAKVPVPNDKYDRAVITKEGAYPILYAGGSQFRLGVPAPDTAPGVAPTEVPTPGPSDPDDPDAVDADSIEVETVSYVYTFVDGFGSEGPPSPPSVHAERVVETDVNLSLPSAPSGSYNWGSDAKKRVYRSTSGSNSAYYLFALEVGISTVNVTDTVSSADLQEVLPSETWVGPPDDDTSVYPDGPMIGICVVANGIMAGFSDKTVCFSEPFMPHAWPLDYRITLDEPIVGIAAIAAGLLVVSEKRPYLVSGVHPASMALTAIDESQGLSNKRGLVDMGTYAIYPSADGLVLVEGASARIASEGVITYEDWKQYKPETIEGYHEEGKYIGFYDGGGFVFDPRGGANAFYDTTRSYRAGYHDGPSGRLLLNSGGSIVSWGDDTSLAASSPYTWRSKKFVTPNPCSMSVMRVEAWEDFSAYPVQVTVFADGVEVIVLTFDDEWTFRRLPAGFRAKIWEFELHGQNPVTYAGLFETMSEVI